MAIYEASVWFGVGAPKTIPAAIIDKLNTEINAAFTDPKIKPRLAGLGRVLPGSPADFGKFCQHRSESSLKPADCICNHSPRWHGQLTAPRWRRNLAAHSKHPDRTGIALTDDAPSQEGTRWPVETAVNTSAV
jgi:hypothetical protein